MNNNLKETIKEQPNDTLWQIYAYVGGLIKERGLVRTRNMTGERGEAEVLRIYNSTLGLPNLMAAPENAKNVDALSRNGERYAIKTISGRTVNTGIFGGLSGSSEEQPKQAFEYLVIVVMNQSYEPDLIVEMTWEQFLKHKRWYKGMKGWNVTVGKKLLQDAKVIFDSGQDRTKNWRHHLYKDVPKT